MASIVHRLSPQVRTTGCLMLRGRSEGRSPSGIWVCRYPGSRRHCAGATTPTTTPTSSSQAAIGGSAPARTEWSPSTRAPCRTGAASQTTWTPLSGTSTVRSKNANLSREQSSEFGVLKRWFVSYNGVSILQDWWLMMKICTIFKNLAITRMNSTNSHNIFFKFLQLLVVKLEECLPNLANITVFSIKTQNNFFKPKSNKNHITYLKLWREVVVSHSSCIAPTKLQLTVFKVIIMSYHVQLCNGLWVLLRAKNHQQDSTPMKWFIHARTFCRNTNCADGRHLLKTLVH